MGACMTRGVLGGLSLMERNLSVVAEAAVLADTVDPLEKRANVIPVGGHAEFADVIHG